MAGIVKSTKRRYLIGKRIKEIEVPGTELDTDLFYEDLADVGGLRTEVSYDNELSILPALVKNEAVLAIAAGGYKVGFLYGFNGDTKSIEEFTFERGSAGTRIAANGSMVLSNANQARLGFSENGQLKGYMFEKASTNYILYSGMGEYGNLQSISAIDRGRCNIVTEDGRICISVTPAEILRFNAITLTEGVTYTYSFWVKATTTFNMRLQNYSAGGGSYSPVIIGITTHWQRIVKTFTARAGATADILHMYNASGDDIPDIFVADIQFEEGTVASSYIPTTTATATRLADRLTSQRPIAVYPKNSFYMDSDRYTGWFGDGVDGLSIQSRNLFPRTNNLVVNTSSANVTYANNPDGSITVVSTDEPGSNGGYITPVVRWSAIQSVAKTEAQFLEGEMVTISIDVRSPDGAAMPAIHIKSGMPYLPFSGNIGAGWNRVTVTRPWVKNNAISLHLRVYAGTTEFRNLKIEKGTQSTPWSPAPEDLVQIDQTGNISIESNGSDYLRSLSLVPRALRQEEI